MAQLDHKLVEGVPCDAGGRRLGKDALPVSSDPQSFNDATLGYTSDRTKIFDGESYDCVACKGMGAPLPSTSTARIVKRVPLSPIAVSPEHVNLFCFVAVWRVSECEQFCETHPPPIYGTRVTMLHRIVRLTARSCSRTRRVPLSHEWRAMLDIRGSLMWVARHLPNQL